MYADYEIAPEFNGTRNGGRTTTKRPRKNKLANNECEETCYIDIHGKDFFIQMNELYDANKAVKENYESAIRNEIATFQEALVSSRGVAQRAANRFGGDPDCVPAGLNLGGDRWMQTDNRSILFFHRMKLRNKTYFQIQDLRYSFNTLTCHLKLNDLSLLGTFERITINSGDALNMFYEPTCGTAELLLRDVRCTVVARLRLDAGRLRVELMKSSDQDLLQLDEQDIKMMYKDDSTDVPETATLNCKFIRDLKDKVRNDLNEWMKDYFNDYFAYHGPHDALSDDKYQKFDNDRILLTNNYTEEVITTLRERQPTSFDLKSITIKAVNGMIISLTGGTVRGLNSLHRRSMATDFLDTRFNRRVIETVVGFSGVRLKYNCVVKIDGKEFKGNFYLTFNEVTAHMCLMVYNSQKRHNLYFNDIEMSEPNAAVDGEAQKQVARFRHLLEHEIKSILTHGLRKEILKLRHVTKCDYPEIEEMKPKPNSGILANEET